MKPDDITHSQKEFNKTIKVFANQDILKTLLTTVLINVLWPKVR